MLGSSPIGGNILINTGGTANIRYEAVMLPWEVTQVLAPERESPVALNMVIAQDTEYVLLDEPTNDLDIHHAANLMKTVRRLCDELSKTVILVLHEIN